MAEDETVYSFCKKREIPILTFDEIKELSPDIGFLLGMTRLFQ